MTYQDDKDGTEKTVQVPIGQNLLEAAHEHDVDLEGMLNSGPLLCIACSPSISRSQQTSAIMR